jgi:hypothetical protein
MRKALNGNPVMQAAVIAVMAILFAILFYTSVLNRDKPGASAGDTTPPAGLPSTAGEDAAALESGAADPAAAASETPAPIVPTPPATSSPVPEAATPSGPSAGNLVPTKGLPSKVLVPLARGEAVALLVIEPKGITDKTLRSYTGRLEDRGDVAVVVTEAKRIGRYSRITQGVNVSQVPALVVVGPREVATGQLTASVTYGFRSAKSLEQAVDDALFEGKIVTPYPE